MTSTFTKIAMTAIASAMLFGSIQAEAGQRAKRLQFQAQTQKLAPAQTQEAPARMTTGQDQGRGAGSNAAVGGIASKGNALANLVIQPYYNNGGLPEGMPGESFCSNTGGGASDKIRFWVKNVGNTTTPSFQWNLYLWESGDAPGSVLPKIAPGAKKLVTQAIPADCYTSPFHGQCPFKIELDHHNEVSESNENDNEVESFCLSPAS